MSGEGITLALLRRMSSSRRSDGEPIPGGGWLLRYTAITRNFGWACAALFALFLIGPVVFPPAEPMTPHELHIYFAVFGSAAAAGLCWSIAKQDVLAIRPWGLSFKRAWWQIPVEIHWEEIAELTYYGTSSIKEGILSVRSTQGEQFSFGALFMHGMPRLRAELKKHAPEPFERLLQTPGIERGLPRI